MASRSCFAVASGSKFSLGKIYKHPANEPQSAQLKTSLHTRSQKQNNNNQKRKQERLNLRANCDLIEPNISSETQ